jgi:hypothetical protein
MTAQIYVNGVAQGGAGGGSGDVLHTRRVIAGTGLTGGGDLSADRTFAVAYGTGAGTAAQGNDSRITGALGAIYVDSPLTGNGTSASHLALGPITAVGTAGSIVTYTSAAKITVTATATDLTMGNGDYWILVTDTSAPRTVTLPAGSDGRVCIVQDASTTNGAATNNITIAPASGTIYPASAATIKVNNARAGFVSYGGNWFGG